MNQTYRALASAAFSVVLLFGTAIPSAKAAIQVSLDFFHENLEPYGDWMEVGDYGYCWHPRDVDDDWRPYSDGRWLYTDAGWTWDSEEPYSWAVYHYGRWTRVNRIGWVWVPGTEWGPAWVSWRHSDRHVGWAPLPPEARFVRTVGFSAGVDVAFDIGPAFYRFVTVRDFGAPRLRTHFIEPRENITIINQTTNITRITYVNNVVYNEGPRYETISRESAQPIRRLRLQRREDFDVTAGAARADVLRTKVEGDTFQVAAPTVEARSTAAPRKVTAKVEKTEVDRGWKNAGNAAAVEKVRKKIKSEPAAAAAAPAVAASANQKEGDIPSIAPAKTAVTGQPETTPATPAKPAVPGRPETTPATPATPAKPAVPGQPETTPATPATPAKPAVPGQPETTPATPATPAKPAVPGRPETTPATPAKPAVPGQPETTPATPDRPAKPGKRNTDPTTPETPGKPGRPAKPAKRNADPSTPETPAIPETPATPDRPAKPAKRNADPTAPETPDRPAKPGKRNSNIPEAPTEPDKPAKTGKPERPAKPAKPDAPASRPSSPDADPTPRPATDAPPKGKAPPRKPKTEDTEPARKTAQSHVEKIQPDKPSENRDAPARKPEHDIPAKVEPRPQAKKPDSVKPAASAVTTPQATKGKAKKKNGEKTDEAPQ